MAKQTINLGNTVNDGTGDALRVGAQKINANFTELYNLLGGDTIQVVSSITAGSGLVASSSSGEVTITAQQASADTIGVVKIGTGITVSEDGTISSSVYTLPRAATNILGGIKVGNNLTIDNEGVLSAATQTYTLPTASISTLGGIRIGSGLEIEDGVVSVVTSEVASALVSGLVTVSLQDVESAGTLTASGDLTVVTKDSGNYLRLQHVLDTETPNLRNVLEVNNLGTSIISYDEENEILSSWTFSNNGNFDASNHSITARNINADNGNISLGPDFGLIFTQGDGAIVAVDKTWVFDQAGNITLPLNGDILNSDGESVLLPTVIDTLTNGEFEASLGVTGALTVPGSIGSLTAISLESGTDTSIVAGTDLKLFADGLFALRNYSTEDSITISTQFNSENQRNWLFGTDGGLTFPDGQSIIRSLDVTDGIPGLTLFAPERIYLGITSSSTSWSWDFRNYGQNDYSTDKKPAVMLPGGSVIEEDLTNQELNNGMAGPLSISSQDKLTLRTNNLDGSLTPEATYDWVFGKDGGLTFPDNTVQTTAYVSNITTESDDNSSVLIPGSTMSRGSLTVRVTVVNDAELSVEINYVEPNNTVKISGSNGTTNLFNGSIDVIPGNVIYYPITTTPLTQVGDIVTAIIADHSFGKMYRITAIYRDIPTESTTASVYCTIEQLI